MTCPSYCPSCGFNLHADEMVTDGPFTADPRGAVSYEGRRLPIGPAGSLILVTLLNARGRPVATETLMQRVSDGESLNIISVHVSRMRAVFRAEGVACPIQTVHGLGYRWHIDPAMAGLAA